MWRSTRQERRAQDMHQIGKRIEPPGAARRVPEAGVLERARCITARQRSSTAFPATVILSARISC